MHAPGDRADRAAEHLRSLLLRLGLAARITGRLLPDWRLVSAAAVRRLLAFGSLVTVAQLADFLYAPTDYVLINRLISPAAVAAYAPAVQIDAGLLLIVSGLSSVLLPKTALAHAAGKLGPERVPAFTTTYHYRLLDDPLELLLVQSDGQAFASLARDPSLARPEVFFTDAEAAYRAQRPLLPYLAWAGSLGRTGWVPPALAVIEQMSAKEIADVLSVPMNTVYSRLRVARAEFAEHVARLERVQQHRRSP